MTDTNPFDALGLPPDPSLGDEQVRAAWRAIAAATHPDRGDGGDLARYTAASAAYAELRAAWRRSEAYADLTERANRPDGPVTAPIPVILGAVLPPPAPPWVAAPDPGAGPGPDHPRPPAPPAAPCCHRRGAGAGRAAADPGNSLRAGRSHRGDHLVRADRPPGPGTPPRTISKSRCLRRGLGLREGPGPRTASRRTGLRRRGVPPVPAGQGQAEQPGPGPSSQDRLTGQLRPALLRVADGDGRDQPQARRTPHQ